MQDPCAIWRRYDSWELIPRALLCTNKVTVDFYRQLNNVGIYEQRRRRAAAATMAAFEELTAQRQTKLEEAAEICKTLKAQGKPFNPQEFGFVHSLPEIDAFLHRAVLRNSVTKPK